MSAATTYGVLIRTLLVLSLLLLARGASHQDDDDEEHHSYVCTWVQNGYEDTNEQEVGPVSSQSDCIERVLQRCPTANIATMNVADVSAGGEADCYCQYGVENDIREDLTGESHSCFLVQVTVAGGTGWDDCDCEETEFCNYESGDTGECEPCSDIAASEDCDGEGDNLPTRGVIDCVSRCFAPPSSPPPGAESNDVPGSTDATSSPPPGSTDATSSPPPGSTDATSSPPPGVTSTEASGTVLAHHSFSLAILLGALTVCSWGILAPW